MLLVCLETSLATLPDHELLRQEDKSTISHSCIHDQIIEQRKRPGLQVYSVTPQVYEESVVSNPPHHRGRALLEIPKEQNDVMQPIRIFLNYDAVGHSSERDCQKVGDIVKASTYHLLENVYEKFDICLY